MGAPARGEGLRAARHRLAAERLAARREVLVARKLELGHEALERMLARELRLSARSSRLMTALSRGRRRLGSIELSGSGLSAEAMPAFYKEAMRSGDEAPLLAAAPDHYLLFQGADGVQQVIEFPLLTPGRIVRAHRWHLACEFSNWIEAANHVGGH